jgi:protocatechuate 3,4-dioxygenase beta subunit
MQHHHDPSHGHGLANDLAALNATLLKRRRALAWLAGAGASALPLISCGGGGSSDDATTLAATTTGSIATTSTTGTTTSTSTTSTTETCAVIPTETNGPYPADGTTALNALMLSGIVRSDIRSSFAGATGVATGVPLTVTLTLVDATASCTSLAGYAIYIWHCNETGEYSLYSAAISGENYLRGVQATDSSGQVTFTTIFPACYSGRWPHIHVEVYPSLATATSVSHVLKTTQIAMPQAACDAVYATSGYSASVANLSQTSLATDMVFSDGATLETPTITGSVSAGYALALTVGISA